MQANNAINDVLGQKTVMLYFHVSATSSTEREPGSILWLVMSNNSNVGQQLKETKTVFHVMARISYEFSLTDVYGSLPPFIQYVESIIDEGK